MDNKVKVGLVTVTYNSANVLPEFIKSIKETSCPGCFLYIIDNASKDQTVSLVGSCQIENALLLANDKNLGVAAGNNQGIRSALSDGAEWILLINNDVVFPSDMIEKLIAEAERFGAGMVVPKMYFFDEPNRIWCAGGYLDWKRGQMPRHIGAGQIDKGQFNKAVWVEDAPTCCMLIRSSVFREVGFMDEGYFVYGDDTDFVYRARQKGFQLLYTPATILYHKVSVLTGGPSSDFSIHWSCRARGYFIAKHYSTIKRVFTKYIYLSYLFTRRISGADDSRVYKKRRSSFKEGYELMLGSKI